jgi:SAM-dependent methyltransferase
MVSLQCAICGEKQQTIVLYTENFDNKKIDKKTFSARRIPDRVHFRLMKCLNCGLIFSNPIFSLTKIKALYRQSGFDYQDESVFLKKTYSKYLKQSIKNDVIRDTRLLDIGCGNGFFLEAALDLGIKNVYGIEPGKQSVLKAKAILKKRIKIGFFDNKSYKNNTFDIICCFQTLDHIVNPNEFLTNVYKVLRKNGKALFIVHNTDGLSVKLFGEKSPIFDIEHMYLFNKSNLEQIFLKNNFKTVETFDIKNTYPLYYWFKMSPLPPFLKKITLIFLETVGLKNYAISLNAGNIGIIAQK